MLVEQQTVSSWLSSGHQPPTLRVPVLRGGGQPGWLGGVDAAAEAQAGQPGHHSAAGLSCASAGLEPPRLTTAGLLGRWRDEMEVKGSEVSLGGRQGQQPSWRSQQLQQMLSSHSDLVTRK